MAAAAAVVAMNHRAVLDAFMRTDAVRPSEAIVFQPKGYLQRSYFDSLTRTGIIKPEGARWYLDIPAYHAAKRKQRLSMLVGAGILAVGAAVAALI